MSSAVMAHLLQLDRPDATPRLPATAEAVTLTPSLSTVRNRIAWRDLPEVFGPWQTVWKRHHRFATDGTWDAVLTALQAQADARGEIDGGSAWTPRSPGSTSTARPPPGSRRRPRRTQGARSNDKNRGRRVDEPPDHAIGRSRGGLTTKTHAPAAVGVCRC
ncbi:MAG: transposase [Actinobacteria bacterium]|nr:transposase [Actinomycetota bacterium]